MHAEPFFRGLGPPNGQTGGMPAALLLSFVLASPDAGVATRAAGGRDAGTVADAGVVEARRAPDAPSAAELERLRQRVLELEARATELEAQGRRVEALTKKVEQTADALAAFKREVNEREEQRLEAERKAAEARARLEAVNKSLLAADQQLATGATNIGDTLRAAEATYTGPALQYVQAARAALANGDLGSARRLLLLAVLEAQSAR